ncbi:MAG: hypothetical protein OXD34_14015 [bacterium]|nr:hypothetical protein [bacterium]
MTIAALVDAALSSDPMLTGADVHARVVAAGGLNRSGEPPSGRYVRRLVRRWRETRPDLAARPTGPIDLDEVTEDARKALIQARREGSVSQVIAAARLKLEVLRAATAEAEITEEARHRSEFEAYAHKVQQLRS